MDLSDYHTLIASVFFKILISIFDFFFENLFDTLFSTLLDYSLYELHTNSILEVTKLKHLNLKIG